MMNVKMLAGSLCVMVAVPALGSAGAIVQDFDFSTDPNGVGNWVEFGTPSTWLNTGAGEWQVNATTTDSGGYYNGGGAGIAPTFAGKIRHGVAEIQATTLPVDELAGRNFISILTLTHGDATDSMEIALSVIDGLLRLEGGRQGASAATRTVATSIAVANQDGLNHSYGWEIDNTVSGTPIFKVFFDGVQVGAAGGYNINAAFYTTSAQSEMYFGAATTGQAHQETYDRWTVWEGAFVPEPATLGLLGLGGALMLGRRRQA